MVPFIHLLLALFKFEEMDSELEENRELAENRLSELQKLQQDLHTVVQENSNMKVDIGTFIRSHQQMLMYFSCMLPEYIFLWYNEDCIENNTFLIDINVYVYFFSDGAHVQG